MSTQLGSIATTSPLPRQPESGRSRHTEEEIFYRNCRAAYLSVFRTSLENITSKDQLCLVLQQAGRNPSKKMLGKYWTQYTEKLNFDDFCEILKNEKLTGKNELMKAFKKLDLNNDGYITHEELFKILTTNGERMTYEEVKKIIDEVDINNDGKLDYNEFCKLFLATVETSQKNSLARLEAITKIKQQQFGSSTVALLELSSSTSSKPLLATSRNPETDLIPKVDGRLSSRTLSARSRKASTTSTITMAATTAKGLKLTEPKSMKNWQHAWSKGCFFLEEDGGIVSHQYRLELHQTTNVYLTIRPLNLSESEGKLSPWMNVDTSLYVLRIDGDSEVLEVVCATELREKEKFGWKGELRSGIYHLLPFTTGCRLRKRRKSKTREAKLVHREDGNLALTKEFRAALSDIFEIIDLDGNGLLSFDEYNFFELRTSGEKCDRGAWVVCQENFDTRQNELTRQGFMDLNLMEANDREGDPKDLWVTLESMGYSKTLEMHEACPFVINIYAEDSKLKLTPVSLETGGNLLNSVICKSVISNGEAKAMKNCSNLSETRVIVHVNNEQSKNCVSSRGLSIFAVEVPPRTTTVCQHVMPINEKLEWIYSCTESIVT
ncbi:EF-hand calcium-binding domain-containing protein 7 isoform X2 [Stegostoma tigrinum]|uniref:EF-hand calcium-binding domain-containing protein 7 isoform X2 n=1 Tax=Stegostoma tigrinum TaxID=3053191 RepID=UPI0028706141|nr:EF-hand calcium-binding domain-containing protein 7 isoform X2 [Stegostoma tigrinum]